MYYGSGAYRYIATGTASYYNQQNGIHSWHTAASGTAGNAITFTQAMTLFASGGLAVGTTTDAGAGNIAASGDFRLINSFSRVADMDPSGAWGGGYNFYLDSSTPKHDSLGPISGAYYRADGSIAWYSGSSQAAGTTATARWSVSSSGHLLAGADNTYDIGASGATRPRTVYAATSVEGGYIRAGAASAGAASTTTIGNGTATTVGAAGAASALPANPLGYIIAHVGTTQVKIPYYNN